MSTKCRVKRSLLSIAVCLSVAIPATCLPYDIRSATNPQAAVRRAYDFSVFGEEQVPEEEILVEDWAIAPVSAGEADAEGVVYTEDGLIDISAGGVVHASYIDGYENAGISTLSVYYDDVPTYTIVQQYDEADLPIELLDPAVFAPDESQFYILVPNSIIKELPDMSSITLQSIAMGAGVTRIGIGDTWSKIRTEDGVEGYVLTASLSDEMVWIDIDRTVWVDCSSLTLRAEPDVESEALASLGRDTRLRCIGVSDKWYKVITTDGQEGYVYISFTTTNAPPTPTPVPTRPPANSGGGSSGDGGSSRSSTGNVASLPVITGCNGSSIVSICESMLGVDYVWAGESSSGVDCSGLVVYAYRQVGISVPHLANSIASCGVSIAREDIQPGDVVCWNTGGGYCGHVGIYVGGGQVIHASNSRDNVCYGSVDMMPILTIRRFIQ